jgi:hypothetical protein
MRYTAVVASRVGCFGRRWGGLPPRSWWRFLGIVKTFAGWVTSSGLIQGHSQCAMASQVYRQNLDRTGSLR